MELCSNNTTVRRKYLYFIKCILSIDVFAYVLVILCYFFTAFVFMTLNHRFSYLTLTSTEHKFNNFFLAFIYLTGSVTIILNALIIFLVWFIIIKFNRQSTFTRLSNNISLYSNVGFLCLPFFSVLFIFLFCGHKAYDIKQRIIFFGLPLSCFFIAYL